MPTAPRFESMDIEGFTDLLDQFPFDRRINAVHMHHTWRPTRTQWKGLATVEAMWRVHTEERGFSDIAQHVTIAPDGLIWTGRNWNLPPASATGHNGNTSAGPFMFEMVGDFDTSREAWEGRQRQTALEVTALVLKRFGLRASDLRFHRQMADKSCPGTGIDYQATVDAVAALMQTLPERLRSRSRGVVAFDEDSAPTRVAARRIVTMLRGNGLAARAIGDAWRDEGELPEADEPQPALTARDGGAAARELRPDQLEPLRPHVVNLRFGAFSNSGVFRTGPADVDRIFGEDLPRYCDEQTAAGRKPTLLFYAHGGLVSESDGLGGALDQLAFYKANHVYPIFFIWETGLLEVLADVLRGALAGARGFGEDLLDRLIEAAAREPGLRVWTQMKRSAETAMLAGGGGLYVAKKTAEFLRARPGELAVHAVGHSAGAIFHAHLLPTLLDEGVEAVAGLQYLAPAVNVATFKSRVLPRLGAGIGPLTVYTMTRQFEQADTAGPYHKSLLYLVHHAFEDPDESPILGLEEHLRADPDLSRLFGLAGQPADRGDVVFSVSGPSTPLNASSRSTSHGGFDNDASTMNSMMRRVLGVADGVRIADFESRPQVRARVSDDPLARLAAELQLAAEAAAASVEARPAEPLPVAAAPAPVRPGRTGFGAWNAQRFEASQPSDPHAAPAAPVAPEPAPAVHPVRSGGARRALCVGVNDYPTSPLAGCVSDSAAWASVLRAQGFDVTAVAQTDATAAGLRALLREAVSRTQTGDVLVFQFAGHGVRIVDQGNLDEPEDEAFVPIDFQVNGFIRDDEIRLMMDELPAGANATIIVDCCHSGGLARMLPTPSAFAGDERPREIRMTPELLAVHRRTRVATPRTRAIGDLLLRRDFWLMACQASEQAWESNGHGDFTRLVSPVLAAIDAGASYEQVQTQIDQLFGANLRQHPLLDCDPRLRSSRLFATTHAQAMGR
jgi:hypothetical protein